MMAGDLSIGADLVNRYVWRGCDFGNAAAVQPGIAYAVGNFEVGAWGSWSINGAPGGNENDLYLSYSLKGISITITDYFFPEYTGDDDIDQFDEDGGHVFEAMVGTELGKFSVMGAMNFMGVDADNSMYFELGYGIYSSDEIESSIFLGAGNYAYVVEEDFNIVNVGISVSKGNLSAAYIINPDQKTSFLTFGLSI